jgi:hypothetical protein
MLSPYLVVPFSRQVDVGLGGLLCLLLKSVQDMQCLGKLGDIDYSELPVVFPDPYFFDIRTDMQHWFLVCWIKPFLHPVELKPGCTSGLLGKLLEVGKG